MSSSSVPLGHKLTAVLLAAAVGGGVYFWFSRRAVQQGATAELSFDMHAARRIDAGFVQAHDPAVVFAQSILTDQKLADLSKSAYLSTSEMMSRVGEFRSRLELTQPAGEMLDVHFNDPDSARAVETANTVAHALTTWAPSPDGPAPITEPTPAAEAQPAPPKAAAAKAQPAAPAHAPAPKPAVQHEDAAAGSMASALVALQAQLSSTNAKLDQIARGEGARGRAYAKFDEQQLLKTQAAAAEQKVADLRAQATGSDRDRLGTIHQALASILSGHAVGVSSGELQRERDALTRAISVVEQQRQAVEKEASASTGAGADASSSSADQNAGNTDAGNTNAGNAAPRPAASPSSGAASGAITESNLSADGSAAPGSGAAANGAASQSQTAAMPQGADAAMLDPLHVVRLAGSAAPVVWWPAVVAGLVCGLLYWVIAAVRQPRYEDFESVGDVSPSYGRFITSDAPSVPEPAPAIAPEPPAPYERGPQRRASFMYESTPEERRREAEGLPAVEERSADPVEVSDVRATAIFEEKVVQIDPWMDLMEKALSETEIGRRYQSPADEGAKKKEDDPRRPGRPDRLAG